MDKVKKIYVEDYMIKDYSLEILYPVKKKKKYVSNLLKIIVMNIQTVYILEKQKKI